MVIKVTQNLFCKFLYLGFLVGSGYKCRCGFIKNNHYEHELEKQEKGKHMETQEHEVNATNTRQRLLPRTKLYY